MAKIDNKEHRFLNIKVKPLKQISLHEFAAFGSDKVKTSLYILNRQQIALIYTFKKLTIIKTKTKMSFFADNKEKTLKRKHIFHDKTIPSSQSVRKQQYRHNSQLSFIK